MKWWKWAIPLAAAAAIPFTGGLSALGLGGGGAAAGAAGAAGAVGAAHAGLTLGELAMLGSGAASAATGIYGAHVQAKTARNASQVDQQNNAALIDYYKSKDVQDQQRYDQEQLLKKQQWDAEQARRAPYRDASLAALAGYRPTPYTPAPMNPMSLGALARRG